MMGINGLAHFPACAGTVSLVPVVRLQEMCGICFEPHGIASMCAASCGHHYCKNCWRSYVHHAVADGPSCLNLRCPSPECRVAVSSAPTHPLFPHIAVSLSVHELFNSGLRPK